MGRHHRSIHARIKARRNKVRLETISTFQKRLLQSWIIKLLDEFEGWKLLKMSWNDSLSEETREIFDFIGFKVGEKLQDWQELLEYFEDCQEDEFGGLDDTARDEDVLASNCRELARQLNLNRTEEDILIFSILLQTCTVLELVTDQFGDFGSYRVVKLLSGLFQVEKHKVGAALSPEGRLHRCGLVQLDRTNNGVPLANKIDLLSGLADILQEPGVAPETILAAYFHPAEPGLLEVKDYRHIAEDYQMILEHLQAAGSSRRTGTNILVYGPPGTGKTELVALLAKELGWQLYTIKTNDEIGHVFTQAERLRALRLTQSILSDSSERMIIFDEADSQLTQDFSFLFDGRGMNLKVSVNQVLEQNPVPTVWVANQIGLADPAYLRRFDIVLHLDRPPRSIRLRILQRYFTGLPVRESWLEQLAENQNIAPAVIEKIAVVAKSWNESTTEIVERRLEKLFAGMIEAMGYSFIPPKKTGNRMPYRLAALNPDHDLEALINGLRERKEGRLCLYGPSGTGKSGFARYLARKLDQPLLLKRASDLLGPFVGQTEAAIAEMFREAASDNAVLLLDEADSFLRERRLANRSWEVTQVNELLTQMEAYSGIFICSTNIMDKLDDASLRRFDFKIKFDYLKPTQAWELFQALLDTHLHQSIDLTWRNRLGSLRNLAPGDFAAANRRLQISGKSLSPANLVKALADECALKKGQFNTAIQIGF